MTLGKRARLAVATVWWGIAVTCGAAHADFGDAKEAAEPASSDRYSQLAAQLQSDNPIDQRRAAEALLRVEPADVSDAGTRKQIAKAFKDMAFEDHGLKAEGVRGMVLWGGKYSVPLLIEMMDREKMRVPDEVFDGLAKLNDPQGTEAVAKQLGNFFNHDAAARALRKIGPSAEAAVIKVAPSDDPKASLAAVQLLGDIGAEKSLKVLQRAAASKNSDVQIAAQDSLRKIAERKKNKVAVKGEIAEDANSPFAASAQPATPFDSAGPHSAADAPDARAHRAKLDANVELDAPRGRGSDAKPGEGDWSAINAILPGQPARTALDPDPGSGGSTDWPASPLRIGGQGPNQGRVTALAIGEGESPLGIVVAHDQGNYSQMQCFDLRSQKRASVTDVEGEIDECYLSPGCQHVLLVSHEGSSPPTVRFDVWSLAKGGPKQIETWRPYVNAQRWIDRTSWAGWLDEDQLFTLTPEGKLVLWQVGSGTAKAIYQIDAEQDSQAALSPGHRYLALSTSRGAEVFQAGDGKLLMRMTGGKPGKCCLAFSPNGKRLASMAGTHIHVWNITNGQLEREFDCKGLPDSSTLHWLDNGLLIAGGSDVIDVEHRLVLWHYDKNHALSRVVAGREWVNIEEGGVSGVVPIELPQAEARKAVEGLEADAILALKPGTKVSLDVQVGEPHQSEVEKILTTAIADSKLKLVADQPIRFVARIENGDTAEARYRMWGDSPFRKGDKTVLADRTFVVDLEIDGKTAWTYKALQSKRAAPQRVEIKEEDESVQTAVDRARDRILSSQIRNCRVPAYVVAPNHAGPLGTSKLTLSGVE